MRDRPHPNHRLEWPGGVVPEWARPQQNPNKRRKGKGPGAERNGGSSPSKRERLQKVMAQSGHGSRRNIEILIAQGHITINGQVAKLGDSVGPGDKVKVDGQPINLRFGDPLPRVLLYHKQTGEIVTRDDPEKRPTVFDRLPKVNAGRWVSVGRLDFNTEGLLIFTTSGELANRLTHPRFEVEREYAVRTLGELTEEQKTKLLTGVEIDGESCKFDALEDRGGEGANHWYHVILREGKNREVRRMMEAVGLTVSRLMRVRFGSVELPSHIKRGMMREMEEEQIQELLGFAGMLDAPAAASAPDEDEEDEFDNIGNRVTEANRDRRNDREPSAELDDLGNRIDVRDNAGNREPDGNRGTYDPGNRPDAGNREGNRPPQHNPRRPHGGKPFAFGKKRGAGRGPQGQGQGQGQPGQHRKHGQNKAHGQGLGQGQAGNQGESQGQQRPPGQGQVPGAGQGKPGRHRRNKNRNRNRNANANPNANVNGNSNANAPAEQQPAGNGNREPY